MEKHCEDPLHEAEIQRLRAYYVENEGMRAKRRWLEGDVGERVANLHSMARSIRQKAELLRPALRDGGVDPHSVVDLASEVHFLLEILEDDLGAWRREAKGEDSATEEARS